MDRCMKSNKKTNAQFHYWTLCLSFLPLYYILLLLLLCVSIVFKF